MLIDLLDFCSQFIAFTEWEKDVLSTNFKPVRLKRKTYLLKESEICDFVAFLNKGVIRHYHTKDGNEITCDITLPRAFFTDFKSLNEKSPTRHNFQILKDSELFLIKRDDLFRIYQDHKNIESFGQMMAEQVALRTIDIALSLASDKPEERVDKLIKQRPDLFQEVPQKYLANLLGMSPESMSRIRARPKNF